MSGNLISHFHCIKCDSSDALAIYEQEDGTIDGNCFSCQQYCSNNELAKSILADELNIKEIKKERKIIRRGKLDKKKREPITKDQIQWIKDNTTFKGKGYRGIKDKYNKMYRVRTEYDEETGEVVKRYYPATEGFIDNKPNHTGYKIRSIPKVFGSPLGRVGKTSDLFGQWVCGKGKRLLITSGEEDVLASKQMLDEARKINWADTDVVSSIIGEGSVAEQCKIQYDFIDFYESIIVLMDNDSAGMEAEKKLLDVLPAGKVKIMRLPLKDACDMLAAGREEEFVRAFYDAKKPKLVGVITGDQMWDEMIRSVSMPLIPLPPMLEPLQTKLCGGLPCAEIISILAASGIGKTSICNNLIQYWIFNSPYKIGILSMEAGAGKFLTRLVSGYLKKNIARLDNPKKKIEFLEEHKKECCDLFFDEEGEERFYLVDDKGDLDNLESIKKTIERMIKQGGCKVIIIDPIQDALDTLSTEEQAEFVGWQKKIKARDEVTFININHTRKSGGSGRAGSVGGNLTEEDMMGSSALYKSSAVNIILTRDKTNEDPNIRNTTKITLFKARDTGDTGPAGELFYEVETASLYNKEEWEKINAGF
jgi:archaellum biogenesis ATPase FlaH